MNKRLSINRENKYVEVQTTINIPFKQIPKGSDFDVDKCRERNKAYTYDLLGSFSKRIIDSLLKRMEACLDLLCKHADSVDYNDGNHIVYHRKDGSFGSFNSPSYSKMLNAVDLLRSGKWEVFLKDAAMIDQTIKALMNDPEQDHSDEGVFKYSELVSLLCECHLFTHE